MSQKTGVDSDMICVTVGVDSDSIDQYMLIVDSDKSRSTIKSADGLSLPLEHSSLHINIC